jgi:hypothetical protein
MEKRIRKWGIYGFLLGMAISILFVDYKVTTNIDGGTITNYKPVFDYIISILRYSIIGLFIGFYVGWSVVNRDSKREGKTYYVAFFFLVFMVAIIFGLLI